MTIDLIFSVFVKHKDLSLLENRDPNLLDIIIADIHGYEKLNPEGSQARSVLRSISTLNYNSYPREIF